MCCTGWGPALRSRLKLRIFETDLLLQMNSLDFWRFALMIVEVIQQLRKLQAPPALS
jgi:hypothetical protein